MASNPARLDRRPRIVARLAWLLLSAALNIYADTPSFNSAVNYDVGISPNALISADLNGDGVPDLVTANINGNSVSVLIGNGDGTFQTAVEYPVGSQPVQIVVADINHDGRPDLAVVNSGSYNITILLGRGDGTFKLPLTVSVAPHPPVALAIGDFNGDGNPDLAVVSSNQSVTVLLGHGDGSFDQSADFFVTFASALAVTQIVAANINSDNILDLVILNEIPNSVTVLLGNGDGTFQVGQTYGVFGDRPNYLVATDLNHDGFIDLAAGSIAGGVSVLLGNGDGTFSYAQSYPVIGSIGGLVATDIDGDGVPDLVVANADNFALRGYVSVFLGNGDGSFAPALNYSTLYAPSGVAVADFDNNGHPDLAVATASASSVSVFLSNAITPQTGFWWNPAESGRGYTIEKQGDNVFMAAYMYDVSGRSTWYGVGPAVMIGPSFSTQLTTFSGGQTLTGAWMAPSVGPAAGNIAVTFSDATHATLSWPGGTTPIEKFPFVPNGLNLPHAASEPQPGWWWNPKEPGRGFSVEVQGGNLFVASYMYDASGDPVWYASGPALLVANAYQGNWVAYVGGQTLPGSYQAPTGTNNAGALTLQFTSRTTAVLTLPDGRQIPLQRFSF
jgi:hypothetical protein